MGENERTSWDDAKNERTIRERKIGFADLSDAFDGRFAIVLEDKRRDYGEQRFNMLVELHGVVLDVTFTPRDDKWRILSARVGNRKERRVHHASQQDR